MPDINDKTISKSDQESSQYEDIFGELWWDLDFWDELQQQEKESVKKSDRMKIISSVLSVFNFIMIVWIVIFWSYLYFQLQTTTTISFLNPICKYIVDSDISWNCSWYAYHYKNYQNKYNDLEWKIFYDSIWTFIKEYGNDNALKTKWVQFLLDKTKDKLSPINIIEEFDDVKNAFLLKDREGGQAYVKWDKKSIQCSDITIQIWWRLSLDCDFYWYDTWTMNLASEFQRDIESELRFNLLSKQTSFTADSVNSWQHKYTYMTKLVLDLQYVWDNYLEY